MMKILLEELVKQLQSRFVLESDCFALQKDDGKYGKNLSPLTANEIKKHLSGDQTIGVYQIDTKNEVKFLCLDVDLKKEAIMDDSPTQEQLATLQSVTMKLYRVAESKGMTPLLEYSGRRGYHLLWFFESPVPAIAARLLGEEMRRGAASVAPNVGIEIFPKQDERAAFGCVVKLPLGVHKLSGKRSALVGPETFTPIIDPVPALQNVALIDPEKVSELVGEPIPASNGKLDVTSCLQLDQPGLDRMVRNCSVIQLFESHPEQFAYDAWLGVGSNFIVFKGGWERFVEFSKRDAAKFSQYEIDRIKGEILDHFHGPQSYEIFRNQGIEFKLPENSPKAPAGWGSKYDPLASTIVEQNGCYGKAGKEGAFELLTPFTIEPKELLMLADGDALTCKVRHATGQEWDNVTIENVDWFTRSKFMKALGHSECTFHGSDLQLIDVCQHVISQVKLRKQGTRVIGLQDDLWVIKNANIYANGYLDPMKIIPYDRSADSLHGRVNYQHLNDDDFRDLTNTFFNNILKVNVPEVVLPILGWFFAAPLKPRIMDIVGSFPILFCYGTAGGGKTSLLEVMLMLEGYNDPTVYSCTMRPFPLLKLLCSTNAVPIVLDEYKSDLKDFQMMDLRRIMRKIYRGEIEDKGTADQQVIHYQLQAPMVVCGESKVSEGAIMERVIVAGFTDEIKRRPEMQKAFASIKNLDLSGFMDRYLMFCLGENSEARMADAFARTEVVLNGNAVPPRVLNNLAAMTFGLELMKDFALKWGIDLSNQIDLSAAVTAQLEEISGNANGQVKLAADQLLEQFSIMAERELLKKHVDFTMVKLRNGVEEKYYLAFHLKTAVQTFKGNLRQIGYDGEVLDEAAYLKQLKTRPYVVQTNHSVRFTSGFAGQKRTKKCVVIDVDKATASGLEVAGLTGTSTIACDDQIANPMQPANSGGTGKSPDSDDCAQHVT
jgi:hypothetical protein